MDTSIVLISSLTTELQLNAVQSLWRNHSETLGFFPKGAFKDHAANGTILIALIGDEVVGYLLYRISKQCAAITHLCIDPSWRRHGIAGLLVNGLASRTTHLNGISLKCRRDFPANNLWPCLSFIAEAHIPGRGRERKELVRWWRAHHHNDLFSFGAMQASSTKLVVAIDMNVLIDLFKGDNSKHPESEAIQADWAADDIELFVTVETLNEMNRISDCNHRDSLLAFAQNYHYLSENSTLYEKVMRSLNSVFPESNREQDSSDKRQLARAISGNADYFVTRDARLLKYSEKIDELHSILVLNPTDLILRLDELIRATEYRPVRFAESPLHMRLIRADDIALIISQFYNQPEKELKKSFASEIRKHLSKPNSFASYLIHDDSKLWGVLVYSNNEQLTNVPILRVSQEKLGLTCGRQIVRQILLVANRSNCSIVRISDKGLQSRMASVLNDYGFIKSGHCWEKILIYKICNIDTLTQDLPKLNPTLTTNPQKLKHWISLSIGKLPETQDSEGIFEIEKVLWPLKIIGAGIGTYVVPIRPQWAFELFDEDLASNQLFGRKEELATNTEAVYYRAARGKLKLPARVLWYVSDDPRQGGTKSIRACSRICDVTVDYPKNVYRKYKHLGIYAWKEVYQTARNDINKKVMAIHFSHTELFKNTIPWSDLQEWFVEHHISGTNAQVIQPVMIPDSLFSRIYQKGTGDK